MTADSKREDKGCEEFQQRLATLLATGENARDHPHLRGCELCRALLDDLEKIAEAARRLFGPEH
jgi:hypothetical protein